MTYLVDTVLVERALCEQSVVGAHEVLEYSRIIKKYIGETNEMHFKPVSR